MIGVRDVPERSWYEVTVDGKPAGHATYRDDGEVRVFLHTEVDDRFEGQGVGSALAQGALEDVRASGRTLVPRCPFIASYIDRHPEYAGLVSSQGSRPRG
jgi:predicted GNAT family acetyltransferase